RRTLLADPGERGGGAHLAYPVQDQFGGAADERVLGDPDVVVNQRHHRVLRPARLAVLIREGGQVGGLVAVDVAVRVAAGRPYPPELRGPGRRVRARADGVRPGSVRDE